MSLGRVLIADDQARFRDAVAALLSKRRFEVILAADGVQALAACRREVPDVALLDLIMPHMDGLAVCRNLRADPRVPYIPIMFFSARDRPADRITALRAGGDDFVGKDVDPEELIARIESLIRIRRMLAAVSGQSSEENVVHSAEMMAVDAAHASIADPDYLDTRLAEEFDRAQGNDEPLSLLVLAIDEPEPSIEVLRAVPQKLLACSRDNEIVTGCRGASYAIIMPHTHFGGALATAERVWRALPPRPDGVSEPFPGLSIGVSCHPNPQVETAADLLEYARAALERARLEGPATVCLHQHQSYIFQPE